MCGLVCTYKTHGTLGHKGNSQPPTGSYPHTSTKYSGERMGVGQETRENLFGGTVLEDRSSHNSRKDTKSSD